MKLDFVSASYLVFAIVMAWDYLSPRLQLARVRRNIRLRLRRAAAKAQS